MISTLFSRGITLLLFLTTAWAQFSPGKNVVSIRGQEQHLYFYPAARTNCPQGVVLFSPGDGGWHGFAIDIAENISSQGYDVFGLDVKQYLESFTGAGRMLKEADVMNDYGQLIRLVQRGSPQPVVVAGWSEGAGLSLLAAAAAAPDSMPSMAGLLAIGLPATNILGWRTSDALTWITKKLPDEPKFQSSGYMPRIGTPFYMIHASADEYTALSTARQLFDAVKQPKHLAVVNARNHRFDGGREEFFQRLDEGLRWIQTAQ